MNSYYIIVAVSILIILSYIFNILSVRTKIPSVLWLLATGIGTKYGLDALGLGDQIPTQTFLEVFGIIGLILIVLEASLELELKREKTALIIRAFLTALITFVVTAVVMALGVKLVFNDLSFHTCLVNVTPFAVISSAIAIPSVGNLNTENREFIIYESTFSDIIGIMAFNILIANSDFTIGTFGTVGIDIVVVVVVSIVFSFLVSFFLAKTKLPIKFFLLFAIIFMLYGFGKIFHFSALLLVLVFGIFLRNNQIFIRGKFKERIGYENLEKGIDQFHLITNESAFVIRTLFFFIFGFSLHLSSLMNIKVVIIGMIILVILYAVRYIYLKFVSRSALFPQLFIAPRGLITILLYFSIPKEHSIGLISEGVLAFVILATSLIMMIGLLRKQPIEDYIPDYLYDYEMEDLDSFIKSEEIEE